MYQSLYRKYRPATFNEIVGQEIPVRILKNAIINNRIAHAYLFSGIRGTGKTSIAKIFAKTVNCIAAKEGLPCNKCVICTQSNGTDIVEIDAASNNGVDEIRDLRDKVSLVPTISKYKVYIIDEIHMLSTSAFNALLKTLEEPPAHAIFILATTEAHKIPLTIISRCQRIDFKPINTDDMVRRLEYICNQEKIEILPDALNEIAILANGGMRDAITILEQSWAYSDNITSEDVHKINGTLMKNEVKQIFGYIIGNNIKESFNLTQKYELRGIDFVKVLDELLYFSRNLMIFFMTNQYSQEQLYAESDYLEFKNKVEISELLNFIKKINVVISEIKTVSNKKTVFEMFIIDYINLENKKTLIEIKPTKTIVSEEFVNKIGKEFLNSRKEPEKEEIKISKQEVIDFQDKVKKIRIDNTLAEFDKKMLTSLKKKMETIREYVIDLQYGEVASIILDGELKAASKEYMIFVYEEPLQNLKFIRKIKEIEELIKISLGNSYKVIAIDNEEWERIKEEFNSKKRKYNKIDEDQTIDNIILELSKVSQDFLDENFSDIITYE